MRYFLHLAYNGAGYCGWQIQNGQKTVQQALQQALFYICRERIELTGCGRTDSGVHALDFYAHFDYRDMDKEHVRMLAMRLNRYFDYDINIYGIYRMKPDAHARFDALSRTYKYYISNNKQPFNNEFCYRYPFELDIERMNTAAKTLYQYSDFTSFSKLHTQVNNNNCEIMYVHWDVEQDMMVFTIKADRFLRNMVRAIVGTLLEVGRGKIGVEDFCSIIEAKDRGRAGVSVPAKGLFLYSVEYDKHLFE